MKVVTDIRYYDEIGRALLTRGAMPSKMKPEQMADKVYEVADFNYIIGDNDGRTALANQILGGAW